VAVGAGPDSFGGAAVDAAAAVSASNGQLFVLDEVVTPPTVAETIERDPDTAMLRVYLGAARVQGSGSLRVDGAAPSTFLAANDAALSRFSFINLGIESIFTAMQNMTLDGLHPSATLEDGERLSSPVGEVTVSLNGETAIFEDAQARQATVVEADIRAANGVIHRVDGAFLSQ
jgi:hypothetical protein